MLYIKEIAMKKTIIQYLICFASLFLLVVNVSAHCEIPCGIYDDEMRISMIFEHISTIEKSMKQIHEIEKDKHLNFNQLIRWVMNKEDHADKLQEIVSQYFMTQRIKTDTKDYEKQLSVLHQMLVISMKCKQTTDLGHVQVLRNLTKEFQKLYFGPK
jgi:nickel superoxide dismutase